MTGRCLTTASSVLRALSLVGTTRDGLSSRALAARLETSEATARYLLNALRLGGFVVRTESGVHRLADLPPWASPDDGSGAWSAERDRAARL